ncbi:ROK family transcriptional regulator [Clostridium perfringens]|nr:ROK family transcriptional regulator [Clostridium perfringens]
MNNKFNIRKLNIVEILNLLFKNPNIARIDISKLINLNKASVSEIVSLLVDKKLINENGTGNSSSNGGRKPILLKINEKAGCSLGIDLGIDYVSFLLTDLNINVLFYDYYEEIINKNNAIEIIVKVITSLESIFNEYEYGLIGVTLSVHGRVFENKIKFTPYYDLDKIDLIEDLSLLMPNINFYIENEANLAAIGEFENSITPLGNTLVINVHSGIGAGIIINNNLYTGFEGYAGEIGHIILVPNGKECPCGNKGCFEQYCSLPSLLEDFNSKSDIKIRTIQELCDLYNSNNKAAVDTITKNIELMSIGIANIFNLFAIDNIFIYSEINSYIPNYLSLINNKINTMFSKEISILPSKLDNKSILFGGVNRCIYNFFNEISNQI